MSPFTETRAFDVDLADDLLDQTQNWVPDPLRISLELLEIDIVDICAQCIDLDGSVFGNDVEISLHASETTLEAKIVGSAYSI